MFCIYNIILFFVLLSYINIIVLSNVMIYNRYLTYSSHVLQEGLHESLLWAHVTRAVGEDRLDCEEEERI